MPKGAGKAMDTWDKSKMLKVTDTGTLAIAGVDETGKATDKIVKEFGRFGSKDKDTELSLSPQEKEYYEGQGYTPLKEEVLAARKEKAVANAKLKEESGTRDRLLTFMDNMDKNVSWDKPMDNKTIAQAKEFQAKNKIDPQVKRESLGKISVAKRLYDVTEKIVNENIEFDAGEKVKASVFKVSDREFTLEAAMDFIGIPKKELSKEDIKVRNKLQNEMLSKISSDTSINSAVADYVKIISGAAVTDEERTRFLQIITGGEYSSTKARVEALSTFIEDIDKAYKLTFDSYKDTNPYEYTAAVKTYQSITKGMDTASLRKRSRGESPEPKKEVDVDTFNSNARKVFLQRNPNATPEEVEEALARARKKKGYNG